MVEERVMNCKELKGIIDSYIADELLVETNHDVMRHLETCAVCRREVSERRKLKMRIRHAVMSADYTKIDPAFAARTSESLRDLALRPGLLDRILGAGFGLNARLAVVGFSAILLMVIGGVFLLNDRNGAQSNIFGGNNTRDLVDAVRVSWNELTGKAIGDHENCAVEYRLKELPISLDEAAERFGEYNKDLDKVIMAAFGNDASETTFVESHSCLYENHRFAHVVLMHKGKLVSVLVTETDLPVDGFTAFSDGSANATGFHFGHKAVFIVSELSDAENLVMAKTVAPALRLHVEKFSV